MPNPKCILTNPETDCIKPAGERLGKLSATGGLSTTNTGKAFGVAGSYLTSLVTMDKDILKEKCGNVLGNKFLYEYGKCKDNTGKIQTRYKYIDATCEAGGTFGGKGAGLIPCTINSAMDVGGAAAGIPGAIFQDSVPPCDTPVDVQCKVSNKGKSNFCGTSGPVYIANDDLEAIAGKTAADPTTCGDPSTEFDMYDMDFGTGPGAGQWGFENLYESVNDYMITNDLDFNNVDENMNIDDMNIDDMNIDNDKDHNDFKSDSTLNEMYYIMLMIFFLFIIYKLMHKK